MTSPAPIALFVYNRPDHTSETLAHLRKNELASESELFIYSDGAKTAKDKQGVLDVRRIAREVTGFKTIKLIERESNLGLANSVISGVTDLVNTHGRVIVFEDDLVSSPYTLKYFNDALERYQNDDKVMHISSYIFPLENSELPETFFFRAAFSWGWATWDRAWKNFEPDIDKLISKFDAQKINQFSIEGTMNFWKQMLDFKAGKNNSWAIRWYASVFLNGGLTLNPSRSLVHNIGHDGSGTHSNIENMYSTHVAQQPVTYLPDVIKENEKAYDAIKYFLSNRKGSILKRLIRRAKQLKVKYFSRG
ncbi:glycosyltransferase [Mucilaginibacter achroorhodeus]|uniref:Glycosyltransferase n=1 Tax=Mucilaginibacter achroorhodeus TaxID=2599294 RepID=A0A563UA47_9SPHI|nr:glycosyltransferase [Mucilaginibacter achroorhodeus]TWR28225.1 glycosyltransferase [Mucilaginibacter achroorhodeus]